MLVKARDLISDVEDKEDRIIDCFSLQTISEMEQKSLGNIDKASIFRYFLIFLQNNLRRY